MVIKFGDVEFQLTLINDPTANPLDSTLRELLRGASVSIYSPGLGMAQAKPAAKAEAEDETPEEDDEEDALSTHHTSIPHRTPKPVRSDGIDYWALLRAMQISNRTITMISNNVLGLSTRLEKLQDDFSNIRDTADKWLTRSLADANIWAIYVKSIQPPWLGKRTFAVGLDNNARFSILGMTDKAPKSLYEQLVKRGLKAKNIKVGVLGFDLTDGFHQSFPETKIARDWKEFESLFETEREKEQVRELMINPNKKEVVKGLKPLKGPPELLTYFDFPKEYWRVLRTANNIDKLDLELRANTKETVEPQKLHFLTVWTLLRIQYQWQRIPVNAKQYESFANVRPTLSK